ncbi:MAG: hypothetical protein WD512_19920, partial [Candidatus Paceibacterota bacterium]
MSKTKLSIILIIGILPLGIVGFLIFQYSSRPSEASKAEDPKTKNTENTTALTASKLVNIPIVNATIDDKNSIRYYSLDKGQTFSIPASGGESNTLDETILN